MATEHPRPKGKKKSIDLPTLIDPFIDAVKALILTFDGLEMVYAGLS